VRRIKNRVGRIGDGRSIIGMQLEPGVRRVTAGDLGCNHFENTGGPSFHAVDAGNSIERVQADCGKVGIRWGGVPGGQSGHNFAKLVLDDEIFAVLIAPVWGSERSVGVQDRMQVLVGDAVAGKELAGAVDRRVAVEGGGELALAGLLVGVIELCEGDGTDVFRKSHDCGARTVDNDACDDEEADDWPYDTDYVVELRTQGSVLIRPAGDGSVARGNVHGACLELGDGQNGGKDGTDADRPEMADENGLLPAFDVRAEGKNDKCLGDSAEKDHGDGQ